MADSLKGGWDELQSQKNQTFTLILHTKEVKREFIGQPLKLGHASSKKSQNWPVVQVYLCLVASSFQIIIALCLLHNLYKCTLSSIRIGTSYMY